MPSDRGIALAFVLLLTSVAVAGPASATSVLYELTVLDTNRYRSSYTVINDGSLGAGIEGFDLFFDPGLYLESSLSIVTPVPPATDWDELILGSGVLVPAVYDAIALAGGIPDGAIQSGFAVEFVWVGSGMPGPQPFQIFDPDTLTVLDSGVTTPIPEPGTLALMAIGVGGIVGMGSSVRRKSQA